MVAKKYVRTYEALSELFDLFMALDQITSIHTSDFLRKDLFFSKIDPFTLSCYSIWFFVKIIFLTLPLRREVFPSVIPPRPHFFLP